MDIFNLWLPLLGGGIFFAIAISAWFGDHKIGAIWFGFVGAVCLLLLAALQLRESELAARAAKSQPQKTISDGEFIRDRAYLDIKWERLLDYRANSQIGTEIVITNVGNTPAFKLKTKTTIGIRSYPPGQGTNWAQADSPMTESTLHRGQSVRSAAKLSEPLPEEFFSQIVSGEKMRLFVWGISTYETLGRERYKKFCFAVHGTREQQPLHPEICDQHNDEN